MSRNVVPTEKKKVAVSVTLYPELLEWIDRIGGNRSQLITELLLREMRAREELRVGCPNPECKLIHTYLNWRAIAAQTRRAVCPACGLGQEWLLERIKREPLTQEDVERKVVVEK